MSRRDRKPAAQSAVGSPDAPVEDADDSEAADLDAAELNELAEHLADAAPAQVEAVAPRAVQAVGLIVCRVHPFGSFNHDMVTYAPGEEALFSRAVIDASNGALIPQE